MAARASQQRGAGVDLWWRIGVHDGLGDEFAGAFEDVVGAKRRARIEHRGGRRCTWLAIDRRTGQVVEQWEIVGNPASAGILDCVRIWPDDPEPTPPAVAVQVPRRFVYPPKAA